MGRTARVKVTFEFRGSRNQYRRLESALRRYDMCGVIDRVDHAGCSRLPCKESPSRGSEEQLHGDSRRSLTYVAFARVEDVDGLVGKVSGVSSRVGLEYKVTAEPHSIEYLSGKEASTLSYLARYPKAKDALALANCLSGEIRLIALGILGRRCVCGELADVVEGYRTWAREYSRSKEV